MHRRIRDSSGNKGRESSSRKIIAVAVIIIVAVSFGAAGWYLATRPAPEERRSYPIDDFINHIYAGPGLPVGTSYLIEDVVTATRVIRTPGLRYNDTGDFVVIPEERMNFTLVSFASYWHFELQFLGDRRADFPVGHILFNITYQEWDEHGQIVVDIEHYHILKLLYVDYRSAIFRGEYYPVQANVTVGSGYVAVRFTAVEDVFPVPSSWGKAKIGLWTDIDTRVVPPRNASLYANGTFVGFLENPSGREYWLSNGSLSLALQENQEIRIPDGVAYSVIRLEDGWNYVGSYRVN